jgi:hypothetical protein
MPRGIYHTLMPAYRYHQSSKNMFGPPKEKGPLANWASALPRRSGRNSDNQVPQMYTTLLLACSMRLNPRKAFSFWLPLAVLFAIILTICLAEQWRASLDAQLYLPRLRQIRRELLHRTPHKVDVPHLLMPVHHDSPRERTPPGSALP